jgi:hypothetical protein
MQLARMLRQYGQGIPGSSAGETAALAQDRALAGQNLQSAQNRLLGSFNPSTMGHSAPTFLSSLANNQASVFGGIDTAHLLASLNNRQQALGEAASTARGAAASLGGAYTPPTPNLGGAFGGLANILAQQNAMNQYGQGGNWANGVPGGQTDTEFVGPPDLGGIGTQMGYGYGMGVGGY